MVVLIVTLKKPVSTHDSCLLFFYDPRRWLNASTQQKINHCNEKEIDGKGNLSGNIDDNLIKTKVAFRVCCIKKRCCAKLLCNFDEGFKKTRHKFQNIEGERNILHDRRGTPRSFFTLTEVSHIPTKLDELDWCLILFSNSRLAD